MYSRDITSILTKYKKFPAIAILGPRQSGKTTLVRNIFKNYTYLSFEDPETRAFAQRDPKQFLRTHENKHGIIIDEFQYVPGILSYIQLDVDENERQGYFVLTGSQNFLMNQEITQSLAGRVGILTLLPLSVQELKTNKLLGNNVDNIIFNGGYPRLYDKKFTPSMLYPSYIQTYVERDVRQLVNVGNLRTFQKFLQLCAGRIGQLLNLSDIAGVCGISVPTAQQWLSILEASYIVFLLRPHFNNFNKRLTKSPKIYFYDTGLACSLLGIRSSDMLTLHPSRGELFECFVIADLYKQYFNVGQQPPLYFWRDKNGRLEIDGLIDTGLKLVPLEIKSGETIASDFFDNLTEWSTLAGTDPRDSHLIYGGTTNQKRSHGTVWSWDSIGDFVKKLEQKK